MRTVPRAARRSLARSADQQHEPSRAAMPFDGPTADIDQVLAEITSGCPTELPQ